MLGQQAQRTHHPLHAKRSHQHGDEDHEHPGQHHPARRELLQVMEVGDVQRQRHPPHRAGVAHHHGGLPPLDRYPIVQPRVQRANALGHVAFIETEQAERVRVLPTLSSARQAACSACS
ncbi:hypothetical protein G6F66_014971 [Rhizopus arrhizus]|nr:hypothetical protein G6F66_014971 [Rhizopus arrhizus]